MPRARARGARRRCGTTSAGAERGARRHGARRRASTASTGEQLDLVDLARPVLGAGAPLVWSAGRHPGHAAAGRRGRPLCRDARAPGNVVVPARDEGLRDRVGDASTTHGLRAGSRRRRPGQGHQREPGPARATSRGPDLVGDQGDAKAVDRRSPVRADPGGARRDRCPLIRVQRLLQDGIRVGHLRDGPTSRAVPKPAVSEFPRRRGRADLALYQSSIGSPMAGFVAGRPNRRSSTTTTSRPRRSSTRGSPRWRRARHGSAPARRPRAGRRLAIADSGYNREDLLRSGTAPRPSCRSCSTRATSGSSRASPRRVLATEKLGGVPSGCSWAAGPNKAQHDLMKAFAAYRTGVRSEGRLRFVGGSSSHLLRVVPPRLRPRDRLRATR